MVASVLRAFRIPPALRINYPGPVRSRMHHNTISECKYLMIDDNCKEERPAADPWVRFNRFLRDEPPKCSGKPLSRY